MNIAPSILSVKKEEYPKKIKELEAQNIKYLHLDVMDGVFVPNTTYNALEIKKIRSYTNMCLDVHLMITDPLNTALSYIDAGADIITFHIEAEPKPKELINLIHKYNKLVGISIKPKTGVSEILPYLPFVDVVLVMSVEPGFGGQSFIDSSLDKIKELDELRRLNNYHYLIEVDGGINAKTLPLCKREGADIFVVGTFLMNSQNLASTLEELKKCELS